jgi:fluoride exporter
LLTNTLLVAVGGAAGSVARYLVGVWAARTVGPSFPVGTLLVNLLGSTALAFLLGLSLPADVGAPRLRLLLGTGLMGGFTTYSTFNYETLLLIGSGSPGLAATNVVLTLLGCFAGGLLGLAVGRGLGGS